MVENDGYRRSVKTEDLYINSSSIISVSDYEGAHQFLIREKQEEFSNDQFSLLKVSYGTEIETMIIFGTAESVYRQSFPNELNAPGRRVLND